jgi:hypothetical protein
LSAICRKWNRNSDASDDVDDELDADEETSDDEDASKKGGSNMEIFASEKRDFDTMI